VASERNSSKVTFCCKRERDKKKEKKRKKKGKRRKNKAKENHNFAPCAAPSAASGRWPPSERKDPP
jgi:hypothetical protein